MDLNEKTRDQLVYTCDELVGLIASLNEDIIKYQAKGWYGAAGRFRRYQTEKMAEYDRYIDELLRRDSDGSPSPCDISQKSTLAIRP